MIQNQKIKNIFYMLLGGVLFLGVEHFFFAHKKNNSNQNIDIDLNQHAMTKVSEKILLEDKTNVSRGKSTKDNSENKYNITKEEQNKIMDKISDQEILEAELSGDEKLKDFYIKSKEASQNKVSRDFDKNSDYAQFYLDDEYDPNWSPQAEQGIRDAMFTEEGDLITEGFNLNSSSCKKHFCEITFTHSNHEKSNILRNQGKFIHKFSNQFDMNLHRSYTYFLDEEQMLTYIYIERCLSCE